MKILSGVLIGLQIGVTLIAICSGVLELIPAFKNFKREQSANQS